MEKLTRADLKETSTMRSGMNIYGPNCRPLRYDIAKAGVVIENRGNHNGEKWRIASGRTGATGKFLEKPYTSVEEVLAALNTARGTP